MGWSGIRNAMPMSETRCAGASGFGRKINVYGPGVFAARNSRAAVLISAHASIAEIPETATEIGCPGGRRFAATALATAVSLAASAPSAYNVSVGYTTSPPSRRICRARSTAGRSRAYLAPSHWACTMRVRIEPPRGVARPW
jgi:hypothetical protein